MSIIRRIPWGIHKPPLGVRHNPSHPLSYGLAGHWLMNESAGLTAYDLSGNRNHGTLTNGPTWTRGQFGPALSFDATDDYVDAGTGTSLDGLGPVTFSAWIKSAGAGELGLGVIVTKDTTGAAGRVGFVHDDTAPEVMALTLFKGAGATSLSRGSADNVIVVGTWQHVVCTWDGTNDNTKIRFYVNGTETAYGVGVNGTSLASDAGLPLVIGNRTDASRTFNGLIDDVRVYKRVLLVQEIQQLYLNPFVDIQPIRRVIGKAVTAAADSTEFFPRRRAGG